MVAIIIEGFFVVGSGTLIGLEILHGQQPNPYLIAVLTTLGGHQLTVYSGVMLNPASSDIPTTKEVQTSTPKGN